MKTSLELQKAPFLPDWSNKLTVFSLLKDRTDCLFQIGEGLLI